MPAAVPNEHTDSFVRHAPEALKDALRRWAALAEHLAALMSDATACHPTIAVEPAVFLAHVAERLDGALPPNEALAQIRAGDLYLACACALGDERAIARLRDQYGPAMRAALAREAGAGAVDELLQQVLTKVVVREPTKERAIAKYAGRGKLSTWLAVTAVRHARNARRSDKKASPDSLAELARRVIDVEDPELRYLKRGYRAEFKRAFERALAALPDRDRTLLRQHYLDGLTVEQIGAAHGVHRVTASRWFSAIRATLLAETRQQLQDELHVDSVELDSVMGLIESQLDVSLTTLLGIKS